VLGCLRLGKVGLFQVRLVHLACGSDSIIGMIRTCGPWCRSLAVEAGVLAFKIHWAGNRPSAKSFPADSEGKAGKRQWGLSWSKRCYDTKLAVRDN